MVSTPRLLRIMTLSLPPEFGVYEIGVVALLMSLLAIVIEPLDDRRIIEVLFIGCERSVPPRARVNDHAAELNGQIGGRTVSWFGRMR